MSILDKCSTCYPLTRPDCEDFTVSAGLEVSTEYTVYLEDGYGNIFSQTSTTDGSGDLTIVLDDFASPINRYSTYWMFFSLGSIDEIEEITIDANTYNCIQLNVCENCCFDLDCPSFVDGLTQDQIDCIRANVCGEGGTVDIRSEDLTLMFNVLGEIPPAQQIIPNLTITNSDGSYNQEIQANITSFETPDIILYDSLNTPQDEVSANKDLIIPDTNYLDSDGIFKSVPWLTPVVCTQAIPSGFRYNYPSGSGERTKFTDGDAKDLADLGYFNYSYPNIPESNCELDYSHSYPFHYLVDNNVFGNKARFTDENGDYYVNPYDGLTATDPSAFSSGKVYDHHTGVMWVRTELAADSWPNACDNYLTTPYLGESGWFLPTFQFLTTILSTDNQNIIGGPERNGLSYYPFAVDKAEEYWLSNTDQNNNSRAMTYLAQFAPDLAISINREAKTNLLPYFLCRIF